MPPFEPRHSPIGSLDQLKYGYAADGPDLELGRNGKRTRHGSKQAYGLSSYGTTGDIDSMKDRFSVEYSPGEKPRTGSMRAGEVCIQYLYRVCIFIFFVFSLWLVD